MLDFIQIVMSWQLIQLASDFLWLVALIVIFCAISIGSLLFSWIRNIFRKLVNSQN